MRRARRSILVVVGLVLLAGCANAGGREPPPTASHPAVTVGSATPPLSAPPADLSVPTESMVWVPAGDHRVPGTLALPAIAPGQQVPAVLLLHGDLSDRNENANLF